MNHRHRNPDELRHRIQASATRRTAALSDPGPGQLHEVIARITTSQPSPASKPPSRSAYSLMLGTYLVLSAGLAVGTFLIATLHIVGGAALTLTITGASQIVVTMLPLIASRSPRETAGRAEHQAADSSAPEHW